MFAPSHRSRVANIAYARVRVRPVRVLVEFSATSVHCVAGPVRDTSLAAGNLIQSLVGKLHGTGVPLLVRETKTRVTGLGDDRLGGHPRERFAEGFIGSQIGILGSYMKLPGILVIFSNHGRYSAPYARKAH